MGKYVWKCELESSIIDHEWQAEEVGADSLEPGANTVYFCKSRGDLCPENN